MMGIRDVGEQVGVSTLSSAKKDGHIALDNASPPFFTASKSNKTHHFGGSVVCSDIHPLRGRVWHGGAWRCSAMLGIVWHGEVRHGFYVFRFCEAGRGFVRFGMLRCGMGFFLGGM